MPVRAPQRELSMGSLNPQLQHLCQAQQQVFSLFCNVFILLIISYCLRLLLLMPISTKQS